MHPTSARPASLPARALLCLALVVLTGLVAPVLAGATTVSIPDSLVSGRTSLDYGECAGNGAENVRFDVSGIPASSHVTSATLTLTNASDRHSLPDTTAWPVTAAGLAQTTATPVSLAGSDDVTSASITAIAQGWVNRTIQRPGLALCAASEFGVASAEVSITYVGHDGQAAGSIFSAIDASSVATDTSQLLTSSSAGYQSASGATLPHTLDDPVVLNSSAGDLSVTVDDAASSATGTPVGGSAVVYADTATKTDTLVRAVTQGVETYSALRDASADTTVSLTVDLPGEERLVQRSDDTIAIVDTDPAPAAAPSTPKPADVAAGTTASSTLRSGTALSTSDVPDATATADAQVTSAVNAQAGNAAPVSTAADLPATSTAVPDPAVTEPVCTGRNCDDEDTDPHEDEAAATSGGAAAATAAVAADVKADALAELSDLKATQDTADAGLVEGAKDEAASAAHVVGEIGGVWARDAAGAAVPTEVTVEGDTVQIEAQPTSATKYPIVIDPWVKTTTVQTIWAAYPVYRTERYVASWGVSARHVGWSHIGWCWMSGWTCANWGNGWWSVSPLGWFSQFGNAWTWYAAYVFDKYPIYGYRSVLDHWAYYATYRTITTNTWYASTWVAYGGADRVVNTPSEVWALETAFRNAASDQQLTELMDGMTADQKAAFTAMYLQWYGGASGQWVDPTGDPRTMVPASASGLKSFFVKHATKLVASAFRHGGEEVSVALKHVDKEAAKTAKQYSGRIADALDDIAKIPGVSSSIVKKKLYQFLTNELHLSHGTALAIADGVKHAIDLLVF